MRGGFFFLSMAHIIIETVSVLQRTTFTKNHVGIDQYERLLFIHDFQTD